MATVTMTPQCRQELQKLYRNRKVEKARSTLRTSQAVPHPSTIRALQRLTSEFGRDPVYSLRYGRERNTCLPAVGVLRQEKNH